MSVFAAAALARPKRDNSETMARIAGSLAKESEAKGACTHDDDKDFEVPAAKISAPAPVAKVAALQGSSLDAEARMAWAAISKPVTEASFVAWYCSTQEAGAAKRPADTPVTGPPAAKKQSLMPGAAAPAQLTQGKRTALLKGVVTSLKAAIKGKKWHAGDSETLSGSTVCDAAEFAALFPGVPLASSGGVLTTFKLSRTELERAFGTTLKATVATYNRPRSFGKSYKTGSTELDFASVRARAARTHGAHARRARTHGAHARRTRTTCTLTAPACARGHHAITHRHPSRTLSHTGRRQVQQGHLDSDSEVQRAGGRRLRRF